MGLGVVDCVETCDKSCLKEGHWDLLKNEGYGVRYDWLHGTE